MTDRELEQVPVTLKVQWSISMLIGVGIMSLVMSSISYGLYAVLTDLKGERSDRVMFGSFGLVLVPIVTVLIYLHRDTLCACFYDEEEDQDFPLSVEVDSQGFDVSPLHDDGIAPHSPMLAGAPVTSGSQIQSRPKIKRSLTPYYLDTSAISDSCETPIQ